MIDKPTFGIPMTFKRLKMPSITFPSTHTMYLKRKVEFWVNKIALIEPPIKSCYGTGSYPPCENGLHLKILHTASKVPFKAPYLSIASTA